MISVNLAYNGYVGLSTDTKPIEDVNNGSRFYEMDTQKNYMFNAEGAEWIEQTAEGGGGGTGGGLFVVTYDSTVSHTDKTWNEVKEAAMAGKSVVLVADADGSFQYDLLVHIETNGDDYFSTNFNTNNMIADSADGYLYYSG